jgi:hypothetical protein
LKEVAELHKYKSSGRKRPANGCCPEKAIEMTTVPQTKSNVG